MLIDNINITTFKAKQMNVVKEFPSVTNETEWLEGSLNPNMLPCKTGFKKIKVTILFKGQIGKKYRAMEINCYHCY